MDEVEGSVLYEMGIAYAVSLLMLFVVGLFPSWFISVIRQITNVWIETPRPVASYLFEGSSELSVGDRVLGGGCG